MAGEWSMARPTAWVDNRAMDSARPEDIAATILHCLGFQPGTARCTGATSLISRGNVIESILV